jgi:hypothetical protein
VTNTDKLREDIAYVRAAADRADVTTIPAINLLWAAIVLCGCVLSDFVGDYRWIGRYWSVAGPGGLCLSWWFGYRAQRHAGQADQRTGVRSGLHWLAFLVAIVLGRILVAVGHLEWAGFASLVVLLVSLTYFHAALHLDRRLLPISGVAASCYLVTMFVPSYQWTLAGVLMAVALVWQALLGARTRDAAHQA